MLIFAFDPSKSTGYSVMHSERDISAIVCGVFQMPDKADHYYTSDQIGLKARGLIKDHGKPDFCVLEEQALAKVGKSSADAMIYPWVATSSIVSVLANYGIPYGTIPPGTWRKMFFGAGFKPPLDKAGKNDWKAAAVAACERHGIILPPQKTIAHNAAEACALAICWRGAKLHAKRYEPAFLNLLQQRNARVAA